MKKIILISLVCVMSLVYAESAKAWTYEGRRVTNRTGIETEGEFYTSGASSKCNMVHLNENMDLMDAVLICAKMLVTDSGGTTKSGNTCIHYLWTYLDYSRGTSYLHCHTAYKLRFKVQIWKGYPWPSTVYCSYLYV